MKLWKSTGWKFGRKLPYLFRYLGKQEEMVLDTLVCRRLSFCFPLGYSTGLQVGLQLCKGFFNLNFGLHPLDWPPNLLSCAFVLLITL